MKSLNGVLSNLEEIETYLTNIEQAVCRLTNWALQPKMVTLVKPEFMEHPHKDVRLKVSSCLNEIMQITSPTTAYNDVVLKKVLQLIVKNFKGLQAKGTPMRQEQICLTCEDTSTIMFLGIVIMKRRLKKFRPT